MFKPLHNYESCLSEKCKDFPTTAVKLIEILLSIEPQKRGTASSALMSEVTLIKKFNLFEDLFQAKFDCCNSTTFLLYHLVVHAYCR
jgi:hypothetical protein